MSASASTLGGTSGAYNFLPSGGDLVLYAFGRCGLRGPQIQAEHMRDARTAANMILSDWANDQPNLWTVDLQTVACVYGQAEYSVPGNTILILDAFLRMNATSQVPIDLYMSPISRTEWAAFPNKTTPGRPTVYWFDRLISPNVTIWQPPSDATWEFCYYRVRQIQDLNLANAQQPEIPYVFLKAFSDALSAELAVIYAPERAVALATAAAGSYKRALEMNSERAPLALIPGISGYYR